MDRTPLLEVLQDMQGTTKELDLVLAGEGNPLEIRNVVEVEALQSSHGIRIATKQNLIWVDASHVSAAYQARSDI